MIIMGVDPGFSYTGFAVLKKEQHKTILADIGYFRFPPTETLPTRVGLFHDAITHKLEQWQVTHLAIETPFLGKNAQNFLKLGYLRGVLYLISHKKRLPLQEFAPTQVKQSVTGFGGAQKDQVARVLTQLFPGMKTQTKYDATDALAISLCGLWHTNPASLQLRRTSR